MTDSTKIMRKQSSAAAEESTGIALANAERCIGSINTMLTECQSDFFRLQSFLHAGKKNRSNAGNDIAS